MIDTNGFKIGSKLISKHFLSAIENLRFTLTSFNQDTATTESRDLIHLYLLNTKRRIFNQDFEPIKAYLKDLSDLTPTLTQAEVAQLHEINAEFINKISTLNDQIDDFDKRATASKEILLQAKSIDDTRTFRMERSAELSDIAFLLSSAEELFALTQIK